MPSKFPVTVLFGPDYLALPRPETPWIVQSLIPKSGLTLVHAPAKAGKSTAIMQLCSALSDEACDSFFGLPIFEHGPVCFLQLDTPSGLWVTEYVARAADAGLNFDQTAFHDRETLPKGLYPFNIRVKDHADWLSEWVRLVQPTAVIIDTYRSAFRGEERDSDLTQQVVSGFQQACMPAAVVLIHHERKENPEAPSNPIDAARGSTALPGMVDVLWRVSKRAGWRIEGRGGEVYIKTKFNDETRLLEPQFDINPQLIKSLKEDPRFDSMRARARHLHEITGLPLDTCRNHLRGLVKHTNFAVS